MFEVESLILNAPSGRRTLNGSRQYSALGFGLSTLAGGLSLCQIGIGDTIVPRQALVIKQRPHETQQQSVRGNQVAEGSPHRLPGCRRVAVQVPYFDSYP